MCGRYYINNETISKLERFADAMIVKKQRELPGGDIHPSDLAPVLAGSAGKLYVAWQRWGFPGLKKGELIFNARSESVLEKRMFQEGIRYHRIAVPGAWFYEWNRNKEKITFLRQDRPVLFMAGFSDMFREENRFVILTTQANASMKKTHSRMPLILEEHQLRDWIFDEEKARKLLAQEPVQLEKRAEYEQMTLF